MRIRSILLHGLFLQYAVALSLFGNHNQEIRDSAQHRRQQNQKPSTRRPSRKPTSRPSRRLSKRPTRKPSANPSNVPTRSPTLSKLTLPLTPIQMIITPKTNGMQIDYDTLRSVLENHLTAFFINDPLLAGSFQSVSLARNITVRRALVQTAITVNTRILASVTTQYDGTATFSQQGAPSAQTLANQQNKALYSEPWSPALQNKYNDIGLSVTYPSSIVTPDSTPDNLSAGGIVGIVIGILVGVGILAFLFIFLFLMKPKKKREKEKKMAQAESPVSRRTRIIVEHNPPPPPPPPPLPRSQGDDMTSDDVESEEESLGWRKYGFSSRPPTTYPIKSTASYTSDKQIMTQLETDDDFSVPYEGENVETTAGDEFLRRVEALGQCSPNIVSGNDDTTHPSETQKNMENPETDKPPDLSLFQMKDGYFAGTVNYIQHIMSLDGDDSHRITVVSGSANTQKEFPSQAIHRNLALPPVVSEDDTADNEDDGDEDDTSYDQMKDKYGVLSPLSDPSLSPSNESIKNTYVPPEALRERVKSAIADSASPTTQERHNAMYQATASKSLSDDAVSTTRFASDSRKNRLTTNTPKEIAINTGDAAELRKTRLQGEQVVAPKKEKGPVASKNLRKARLAQEHSSARVSKQNEKDLYAV